MIHTWFSKLIQIIIIILLITLITVASNAADNNNLSEGDAIDSATAFKQDELLKKYRTKQAVAGILWPKTLGELLNFGDEALKIVMYEIAGEAYKRAGQEAIKTDDKPTEAYITGQQALCYQGLNKDGLAVEFFRNSASSYHTLGDLAGESRQLCGLAISQQKRKQTTTAENSLRQAFKLSGKADDRIGAMKASFQLGELFYDSQDYKKALLQYHIALPLSQKPLDIAKMAIIFTKLSKCYSKLNNIEKGSAYLDSATAVIDKYNLTEQQ